MSLTLHSEFLKLPIDARYLLGISGGRDSVALLHVLLEFGFKNLVLCHVNHRLRGDESDGDALFVQKLAEQHHLEYKLEQVSVTERMHREGESMELAARNRRHQFFAICATKYDCQRIILAHHADDQAETILFNLLRGSGGLRGMQFLTEHTSNNEKLTFYRPLIETTRRTINAYLQEHNINYREDSSNTENVATRNQIRHKAIPILEQIMGREIREPLRRAEEIFREKEQALTETLRENHLEDPQGRLYLPKIRDLHPALQRMALHNYLKAHKIPQISHDLLTRCLTLLEDDSISKINLPGNSYFRRKEKRLFVDK